MLRSKLAEHNTEFILVRKSLFDQVRRKGVRSQGNGTVYVFNMVGVCRLLIHASSTGTHLNSVLSDDLKHFCIL
jgi:hypothetical protein